MELEPPFAYLNIDLPKRQLIILKNLPWIMNVTNQNQSLVKSELDHYFIRLMICKIWKCLATATLFLLVHIVVDTICGLQLEGLWQ